MKKLLTLLLCSILFILSSFVLQNCQNKNYQFAKFSVRAGLEIGDEAGVFKPRTFIVKQEFNGDTIFHYKGINEYTIIKTDTAYIVKLIPNRERIQDTIFHYIDKQNKQEIKTGKENKLNQLSKQKEE